MFRLNHGRYIVGYALGDDGMLFRGEMLTGCSNERASHEALALTDYWAGIDAEDEADPWHGEPDDEQLPRLVNVTGGAAEVPPHLTPTIKA